MAVGGANLSPADEGWMARAVDRAPGAPQAVLLTDVRAEHLAGCNMAFRTDVLRSIGGFDERFWIAGDDVDICWRLEEAGWTLGYSPMAVVWHRRRDSITGFWRQQVNYGRAEAMLERRWPAKFNPMGHMSWSGRLYATPDTGSTLGATDRVYHGVFGSAGFQRVYRVSKGGLDWFLMLPERYLLVPVLGLLSLAAAPTLAPGVALGLLIALVAIPAGLGAASALRIPPMPSRRDRARLFVPTALLHAMQPLARLYGRILGGLTPWRRRAKGAWRWPRVFTTAVWTENGPAPEQYPRRLEHELRAADQPVVLGNAFDRWDLGIRGGLLASARLLTAVEDHGGGKQYVRVRVQPHYHMGSLLIVILLGLVTVAAGVGSAWLVAVGAGLSAAVLFGRMLHESARATAALRDAVERLWSPQAGADD